MNTKEMSKEELRKSFDKHEGRRQASIDDYEKVLKIDDKKPLQIFLALKWLRQAYENRVMFLKNQCGMSAEESAREIHGLSANLIKETGAVVKAIEAGEFDTRGGV